MGSDYRELELRNLSSSSSDGYSDGLVIARNRSCTSSGVEELPALACNNYVRYACRAEVWKETAEGKGKRK